MKSFTRADRVGALIQRNLSEILRKDIGDPRLEMVLITSVKVSRDIKNARIYFSASGQEAGKEATEGFESASGYIKRTLAGVLGLRYMPALTFVYDDSFDYGSHIDRVLRSIDTDYGDNHTTPEE